MPTRRRAFRSASEEYAKILDLVGRYAVHCGGVAFSCKKHGEASMGISVAANATTIDRIRTIHGSVVANELIQFQAENERWGFKSDGYVTNANYHVKRLILLLFINHRAVESSAIKKAVEQTYSTFLPKGGHPFIYLSLDIDPQRVDVNIHPTKREVNYLNEDEIIEIICDEIRTRLGKVDTSRTFMTQSLLPGVKPSAVSLSTVDDPVRISTVPESPSAPGPTPRSSIPRTPVTKPYENNLVRTDSKVRKITSMLPPGQQRPPSSPRRQGSTAHSRLTAGDDPENNDTASMEYEYTDREPTTCKLTTIKELRATVRESMHNGLTDVFATHTFVGIVDERRRIAAIQAGVKLLLVDYGMICNEYFYQVGLTDFGNFGTIRLDPPLSLRELLDVGARAEQTQAASADEDGSESTDWDDVVTTVEQQLISRREMLAEYFAIDITVDGYLASLPLLMKGYLPSMAKLPRLLLRLGPHVEWNDEKGCFHTFLRELASWYVPEALPPLPTQNQHGPGEAGAHEEDQEIASRRVELNRVVEHVLFPAFRVRLVATKGMLKGVLEVANLKGLYRVFERC